MPRLKQIKQIGTLINMQVILLKDVKNVGKKDQIVNVSDGYANNYLFKNRLAVPASKKGVEVLENQQEERRIEEEHKKQKAQELVQTLKGLTLEFVLSVGKDGRTFGSISYKQVEEQLLEKFKISIDKRKFLDNKKMDSIGYYNLRIELYKGVIGEVKVHISERKN